MPELKPDTTAADLRQQIGILANTIATGEAHEAACYEAMARLLRRLDEMEAANANA